MNLIIGIVIIAAVICLALWIKSGGDDFMDRNQRNSYQ